MAEIDVKRLLLKFEKSVREINRDEINPTIPELQFNDLDPVIKMVAKARADYLKALFELAGRTDGELPEMEQIKELQKLRLIYEELVEGAKALETAIERGYLDVVHI
jgi:hypothetical protein